MRKWIKGLTWVSAGGAVLQLSCSEGLGKFFAPVVQPVLGQILSSFASIFVQLTTSLVNQALGIPTTPVGS